MCVERSHLITTCIDVPYALYLHCTVVPDVSKRPVHMYLAVNHDYVCVHSTNHHKSPRFALKKKFELTYVVDLHRSRKCV